LCCGHFDLLVWLLLLTCPDSLGFGNGGWNKYLTSFESEEFLNRLLLALQHSSSFPFVWWIRKVILQKDAHVCSSDMLCRMVNYNLIHQERNFKIGGRMVFGHALF
jgi:hypothetical protein